MLPRQRNKVDNSSSPFLVGVQHGSSQTEIGTDPILVFGWSLEMDFEFRTQFQEIEFQYKSLCVNSLGVE